MTGLGQLHDIDLKLLRCFCTIVEEGSFAAAQSTLNLSQSMLSEYMKTLEIRLGTRLCQRGPKGFKLYHEGELVYHAAKELFSSVEGFRQKVTAVNDGSGYEISLAIQDGIIESPRSRIAEAIERFSEYYPKVTFHVELMLGFRLMAAVADGTVNVGIGLLYDRFPHLSTEPLYEETVYLCCGVGHPLFDAAEDTLDRETIEAAAYCHRGHLEFLHPPGDGHFEHRGDTAHGSYAHLALILSGRNIGYLPDHMALAFEKAGRLRILRADLTQLVNPVVAVTGSAAVDFKLARRFVDCLIDVHMERAEPRAARAVAALTREFGHRDGTVAPLTVGQGA